MKEYDWLERYSIRINEEKLDTERKEQMNLVNQNMFYEIICAVVY
jgi:Fe-S cluster biosynthesis and repair protein YggX